MMKEEEIIWPLVLFEKQKIQSRSNYVNSMCLKSNLIKFINKCMKFENKTYDKNFKSYVRIECYGTRKESSQPISLELKFKLQLNFDNICRTTFELSNSIELCKLFDCLNYEI